MSNWDKSTTWTRYFDSNDSQGLDDGYHMEHLEIIRLLAVVSGVNNAENNHAFSHHRLSKQFGEPLLICQMGNAFQDITSRMKIMSGWIHLGICCQRISILMVKTRSPFSMPAACHELERYIASWHWSSSARLQQRKEYRDHMDGLKTNNHFSSLRWCSARENAQYAMRDGFVLTVERMDNREVIGEWCPYTSIYHDFGCRVKSTNFISFSNIKNRLIMLSGEKTRVPISRAYTK